MVILIIHLLSIFYTLLLSLFLTFHLKKILPSFSEIFWCIIMKINSDIDFYFTFKKNKLCNYFFVFTFFYLLLFFSNSLFKKSFFFTFTSFLSLSIINGESFGCDFDNVARECCVVIIFLSQLMLCFNFLLSLLKVLCDYNFFRL
jgi:hypothetical protein